MCIDELEDWRKNQPTPPEGEADPLSPLLDMSVVEGLSEELRKAKAEGEAVPEPCGVPLGFSGYLEVYCKETKPCPKHSAAPAVSTAAPDPKCVKSYRHASSYKVEAATPKPIGDVEALLDELATSPDKTYCQRGRAELRAILSPLFALVGPENKEQK